MPISETVSEKPKRGRPRKYEMELAVCRQVGMDLEIRTHRGKQNRALALIGLDVVSHHPHIAEIVWLYDAAAMRAGKGSTRWHVYTELGRIYSQNGDDHEIHDLAETLCRDKPNGKDAVRWLRRYRRGVSEKYSVHDLTERIATAINEYGATHPKITAEAIHEALRNVAARVVDDQQTEAA
jgi:hypothetical protein